MATATSIRPGDTNFNGQLFDIQFDNGASWSGRAENQDAALTKAQQETFAPPPPNGQGPVISQNANPNGAPQPQQGYKANTAGYQTTAGPVQTTGATPTAQAPTNVNAGRVSVTLGNGQTVYYDKNGQAYDTNGAQVSNSTIASSLAPSSVSNPANPPSGAGTPTIPQGQGGTVADTWNASLAATLTAQQNQLQQSLKTQQDAYQSKIDAAQKQSDLALHMQEVGLASEKSVIADETAAKQAALDKEQQQFQQNYDARQKLVDQLGTLLTTGQQVIQQMKGTTGLASIMNPRITQTMTDVQAQAGVIQATLSAMSDQIGLAQNQLKSTTDAITSIYHDQLAYWDNVINFYNDQQKISDAKVASLSKTQQSYIDAQIQIIQNNINQTQATATLISKAMLDPQTALAYSKAGVTLKDSPQEISQKLATYEAAQAKVWSAPQLLGGDYIQTNSMTGETRTVVSNVAKAGTASADTGSALSDAAAAIAKGADPTKVKQAFLADHPSQSTAWSAYFTDASGTKYTYPTSDDTTKKSGLFGWGFLGL